MTKTLIGIVLGVALVLCSAAAYRITVAPSVYTDVLDPNDGIYTGLLIHKDYIGKFGACERTLLFYNVTLNRGALRDLIQRVEKLEKLSLPDPNQPIVVPVSEPNLTED